MLIFERKEFRNQMRLLGITQEDLIEILYAQYGITISRGNLSKILNGSVRWNLELALAVSEILEIETRELFIMKKSNELL